MIIVNVNETFCDKFLDSGDFFIIFGDSIRALTLMLERGNKRRRDLHACVSLFDKQFQVFRRF